MSEPQLTQRNTLTRLERRARTVERHGLSSTYWAGGVNTAPRQQLSPSGTASLMQTTAVAMC